MQRAERWYVGGVAVLGAVLLAIAVKGLPFADPDWPALVVLGLIAVAAVWVPIRIDPGGPPVGLETGVLLAMLLALPAGWPPFLLVAATILGLLPATRDIERVVFGAGSAGVVGSAGALVYEAIGPTGSVVHPASLLAVGAVLVIVESLRVLLVTELTRRQGPGQFRETWRDVSRLALVAAAGNGVYGVVLGDLGRRDAVVTALGGTLIVGLFLAVRGWNAARGTDQRATGHHHLSSVLLDVSTDRDRLGVFLTRLSTVFDARSAALYLEQRNHHLRVYVVDDRLERSRLKQVPDIVTEVTWRVIALRSDRSNEPWLVPEGHSSALAAPLVHSGRTIGALVVHDRRGVGSWTDADASWLGSIANEAAAAVRTVELLQQVEAERGRWEEESTRLADVLRSATDGIANLSPAGRIETWNPGMELLTGVSADDAVAQTWFTVLRLRDAKGNELLPDGPNVIEQVLRHGEEGGERLRLQLLRSDGSWRWISCTIAAVHRADGSRRGAVLVARDVTAAHEVEQLKADFLATISHELRTPLTPLKGFVQTVRARGAVLDPEQTFQMFEGMGKQVERLEDLVADLLTIADLDNEATPHETTVISLHDAAEQALAQERAGTERVEVESGEGVNAVGDRKAVTRIMRALISNGLKHTEGSVTIAFRTDAEQAHVDVIDEGPGVPPWEHERIFERFGRLGDHLRRTQGPGLGLAIARALAENMGGSVAITSDVTQGSVFTLSLPRARPRQMEGTVQRAG
jgi:PAS domain S-box-containing protein